MCPGEVCAIKPCDIDRTDDVWLFVMDTPVRTFKKASRSRKITRLSFVAGIRDNSARLFT